MGLRSFWGAIGGGGIARTFRGNVANQAAMLALPAVRGDWCIRTDSNTAYELVGADATLLANWQAVPNAGAGGSVQNSLTPPSTTVPPSVDAVTGGLAGKANTTHSHTAANVTDFNAVADARADGRIAAARGAANGVASLDGAGIVPASQLPSYVDDVLEYANQAAFPGTGETGKIYVALDTNATYRWSGSAYVSMGGTPQYPSQAEAEGGVENTKTMTSLRVAQAIVARAKDALLTGYAIGANAAVAAADTVMQAIGKLQAQVNAKASVLAPVTISANTNLTAAAHANRQIRVDTAGVVLTVQTDAAGGTADDDSFDIQAVGAGSFTLNTAAVTVNVAAGMSISSATAAGKRVQLQRSGANTYDALSLATPSGGGALSMTTAGAIGSSQTNAQLAGVTIPGGTLTAGKLVRVTAFLRHQISDAGGIAIALRYGGQVLLTDTLGNTFGNTTVSDTHQYVFAVTGASQQQATPTVLGDADKTNLIQSVATVTTTVDGSASQTLELVATTGAAGSPQVECLVGKVEVL